MTLKQQQKIWTEKTGIEGLFDAELNVDTLQKAGGKLWEKGAHRRVYFNNLAELGGLEYCTYKTGNISSASLAGERISNSEARRLLAAKLYFDLNTGEFVRQGHYDADDLIDNAIEEIKRRC